MIDTMKLLHYIQSEYQLARRKIVACIQSWWVLVNDKPVESFNCTVTKGDHIVIKEYAIDCEVQDMHTQESSLVLYHKPIGYTVSKNDIHNQTIYDILPNELQGFHYIGRLDKNSSGLLLLTNDLGLVHQLGHPSADLVKVYVLEIDTWIRADEAKLLLQGMWLDENGLEVEQPKDNFIAKEQWIDFLSIASYKQEEFPTYVQVTVLLKQGYKRHLRRIMKAIGKRVITLHRISFGPYHLWEIKVGEWNYISLCTEPIP